MPLKWGVHGTLETIPRDHRIEHARECPSPFLPNCSANKYCTRYKEAIQVVIKLKSEYPRDYLFNLEEANLRKDAGEGMAAVEAYRAILAANEKSGYFYSPRLELTYFGLGDALRGQRHYAEAAQAYEKAAGTANAGLELRIRSLLDAGECRDLNGERQRAVADYNAAVDAGPNTSRADTARKYMRHVYAGN